jgi:hypothetical protein
MSRDVGLLLLVVAICTVLLTAYGVGYAVFHPAFPELFRSFPGSAETAPAARP